MPSLKDIRRRIGSVKNTQKITKSMKMVSGAKLRRAEQAAQRSRPYVAELDATLRRLLAGDDALDHPLTTPRESVERVLWIVISSDRGLCGSFNAALLRATQRDLRAQLDAGLKPEVYVVGRKARDFFKRRTFTVIGEANGFSASPGHGDAAAIAQLAMERFIAGDVDEVRLVFNEFVSALVQRPITRTLLPVQASAPDDASGADDGDAIFEPHRSELLEVLLPRRVETRMLSALLESAASEHAARMAAMESATKNAGEMIESLTLQFNKARQAAITKELMEIVGGAEALASG